MAYSALKQHSENKKYKGFSSTLQKVKDKEEVEEADEPKCTDSQKVLEDFFVKSSTNTSKARASSVETSDFAQDIGPSTSQTSHRSCVDTTPVSCKGRDNSRFTVCFTKYTLQLCRCTPGVLQTTVSRLSNSKTCFTWIKKVKEVIQGNSYFTLHFDETVSTQMKKHVDLLVCY